MVERTVILLILVSAPYFVKPQLGPGAFKCRNGILIPISAKCDGYPDCGSEGQEDEGGCGTQFTSTGGTAWAGQSRAPGDTWTQPQPPRGPFIRPPPQPSMSWNSGRYPSQYAVDTTQYRPSYPVPDVCKMTPPASCPLSWIGQTPRWFFNTNLYTCVEFMYGCGKGHNNFISESECKMVCSEKPQVVYNLPRGNRVPPSFQPWRPADPNFYSNQPNQINEPITRMPPVYRGPVWDSSRSLTGLTGLTKSTFDRYLQNNRHVLVEFYANWCQTCVEFQPKFKLMARQLNSLGVATAQVNAVEEDELRRRFNVQNVPTLLFWSRDLPDCPRKFSNKFGLNSSSIVSWVQNQLGTTSSQISWMLSPSSSSEEKTFPSSVSPVPVLFSTFRPQETTFTFRPQPTTSTRIPAQTIFTIKPEVANPAKTTTPTTFKPQPAISTYRPQTASTTVNPAAVTIPIEVTFTAQPASSTIKSKPVTSTFKPQPSTFKPEIATSTFKEQLVTATFKPQTATSTATAQLATSPPMEATTTMYGTTYSTSDVLYAWANDMPTGTSLESACDTVCVKAWNPVCGSDNKTYSNLCEYNVAQCKNSDLYMLGTGECSNLQLGTICKRTEFLCQESGKCISFLKTCNGKLDCENGSDEMLCEGCSKTEFTCGDGTCIDYSKRCDKKIDCKDSSDESGCMKPCSLQEFTCNDGSCIEQSQRCDGQIHCKDMTDEIGCDAFNFCLSSEWMCVDKRRCISSSQRCDGFPDCGDVSDEQGCPPQTCDTKWLFPCSNSTQCIDSRRRCDGFTDCQDRSDERGCRELQCQEWQFKCKQDGVCLHEALRCDRVQDCRDGSDEDDCFSDPESTVAPYTTILPITINPPGTRLPSTINPPGLPTESAEEYIDEGSSIYTTEIYYQTTTESCSDPDFSFYCDTGDCIDSRRRCDGSVDCSDESDENGCQDVECRSWQFKCKSTGICIHRGLQCNGEVDCLDSTDENNCDAETNFSSEATESPIENEVDQNDIFGFENDLKCKRNCPRMYLPVCGSDEVTYSNKCLLDLASCLNNVELTVSYYGECIDRMDDCPHCSEYYEPVCGSNNISYNNTCLLSQYNCISQSSITIKNTGLCEIEGMEPEEETCSLFCTRDYNPVCGTDGVTYENVCSLNREACLTDQNITVLYNKGCQEGQEAPQCTHACTKIYLPLCGSDGVTYSNECMMQKSACTDDRKIDVVHSGPCIEAEETNSTQCNRACPKLFLPVCGDNGVTYENTCSLELAECLDGVKINVAYAGICRKSEESDPFAMLFGNSNNILCPTSCPDDDIPVCGDNSKTYRNECEMRMEECTLGVVININYKGECKSTTRCSELCESTSTQLVCGSDRLTYDNVCQLQIQACQTATNITVIHQGGCSNCHPLEEWMCRDTMCVSNSKLCDGRLDCKDGSDESFCEFVCKNGDTIRLQQQCDGFPDCMNGEDENDCSNVYTAGISVCDSLDEYMCKDTQECISRSKVCDGEVDCLNEDDEFDCARSKVPNWNEVVWTGGDYGGVDEDEQDGRGDITADEEVDYSQDWF